MPFTRFAIWQVIPALSFFFGENIKERPGPIMLVCPFMLKATDWCVIFNTANLFLGSYYAIKGQEKLKSIDQQYLEDSNGLSISASVYKEEKRQVINGDIACAKKYFTIAARVRSNKYLLEQLSMLSGLSDELPHSSGVIRPFLNRFMQE